MSRRTDLLQQLISSDKFGDKPWLFPAEGGSSCDGMLIEPDFLVG